MEINELEEDVITITITPSDNINSIIDLVYSDEFFDRDLYIEGPRDKLILVNADMHVFEGDFQALIETRKGTFIRMKDLEDEKELIELLNTISGR